MIDNIPLFICWALVAIAVQVPLAYAMGRAASNHAGCSSADARTDGAYNAAIALLLGIILLLVVATTYPAATSLCIWIAVFFAGLLPGCYFGKVGLVCGYQAAIKWIDASIDRVVPPR